MSKKEFIINAVDKFLEANPDAAKYTFTAERETGVNSSPDYKVNCHCDTESTLVGIVHNV